jgi:hypothetical protein
MRLDAIFQRLRHILHQRADGLSEVDESPRRYSLVGEVGQATVQAWGGRKKRPTIPVAWVETGKAYVSYHLMGIENPDLCSSMSNELKARMHGKTCFNFKTGDEALFKELETVTARSISAFMTAGFVVTPTGARVRQ